MNDPDAFPLILLAAWRHPDPALQRRLKKRLHDWVRDLGPELDEPEVVAVIAAAQGTMIEPFVLDGVNREIAVLLALAALSKAGHQKRFRIVSEATIGTGGGLLLSGNGKSTYLERLARKPASRTCSDSWRFVPASEPDPGALRPAPGLRAEATARDDALGWAVLGLDVERLGWRQEEDAPAMTSGEKLAALECELARHSTLAGQPFASLRLGVRLRGGRLEVKARTPEAILRLTALMFDGAPVRLEPGPACRGRHVLGLRLAEPEEGRQLAVGTYLTDGYWGNWLRVPLAPPQLDHEEMVAIGRWACCHADWFDVVPPEER